jgi:hypothetical protein
MESVKGECVAVVERIFTSRLDFIGIGVQKSATSWITQCLIEHPQIRMGVEKETNFFSYRYLFGYPWYHDRFQFGEWKTGEYSTSYFFDRNVPARIHQYRDDVKLILSLRNPIDRAFSQHTHEVRRNRLPPELFDFHRALAWNPTYVDQGRYATHIRNFLEFFDFEQIHVILYDDIKRDSRAVVRELYRFLAVDSTFVPSSLNTAVNVARVYRSQWANRILRYGKAAAQKTMTPATVEKVGRLGIYQAMMRLNERPHDDAVVPAPSPETRAGLRSMLSTEIEELERLLKRDLGHWR